MKVLIGLVVVICLSTGSLVHAWGGLFNRFNPSLMNDFGYGKELYRAQESNPVKEVSLFIETDTSPNFSNKVILLYKLLLPKQSCL